MRTPQHNGIGPDDDAFWNGAKAKASKVARGRNETQRKAPMRIGLEYPDDIEIETTCNGIIKGVVSLGTLAAIYGPSGVGKSFVVKYLGFCVAHGRTIAGRRTRKMPVLYIALEGQANIKKRIKAAKNKYGSPGKYFSRMTVPALLTKGEMGKAGLEAIVAHIEAQTADAGEPVGLVIIDTLARAMAGDDENSAQDMSAFIEQRAAEIIRRTGVAVLIVHHTGKDSSRGMRGSYALFGAADAVIRCDENQTVELEKVKDGAEGTWFAYRLSQVELGVDDHGDPITTCVVETLDAPTASKQKVKLPRQAEAALGVLRDLYLDGTARHVPKQQINGIDVPKCVTFAAWRAACKKRGLTAAEDDPKKKAEAEKKAFGRARDKLEDAGFIATYDEEVWLIGQSSAGDTP